jgi:hypothetical protein
LFLGPEDFQGWIAILLSVAPIPHFVPLTGRSLPLVLPAAFQADHLL